MNTISAKNVPLTLASGVSGSSQVPLDCYDALMVYIPAVVAKFASGTVVITVNGSPNSGITALPASYYGYASGTANPATVTATTGGMYELPYLGPIPQIQLSFSTTVTGGGTTAYLVYGNG